MCYWKTEFGEYYQWLLESYSEWCARNSVMMTPTHRFFPYQTRLKKFSLQKFLFRGLKKSQISPWIALQRSQNSTPRPNFSLRDEFKICILSGNVPETAFCDAGTPPLLQNGSQIENTEKQRRLRVLCNIVYKTWSRKMPVFEPLKTEMFLMVRSKSFDISTARN